MKERTKEIFEGIGVILVFLIILGLGIYLIRFGLKNRKEIIRQEQSIVSPDSTFKVILPIVFGVIILVGIIVGIGKVIYEEL